MQSLRNDLVGNFQCRSNLFLRLARIVIEQCLQFSVLEGFWPSFTRTVVNIEITVFEATERRKSKLPANDDYLAQNQTF